MWGCLGSGSEVSFVGHAEVGQGVDREGREVQSDGRQEHRCKDGRRGIGVGRILTLQARAAHCTGTALAPHLYCTGIAVLLHGYWNGTLLVLHWHCAGSVLELCWNYTGTVLVPYWNCTGTGILLVQHQLLQSKFNTNTHAVPIPSRNQTNAIIRSHQSPNARFGAKPRMTATRDFAQPRGRPPDRHLWTLYMPANAPPTHETPAHGLAPPAMRGPCECL